MTPPPDTTGPERQMLTQFLDHQRDIVIWKLEGIDTEAACRPMTPSGSTLLGLVKHLMHVEFWWFTEVMLGLPPTPEFTFDEADPDKDFRIEPGETVESILAGYRAQIATSNEQIAGRGLDELCVLKPRDMERSLRWVLLHMIEETARHAGHADILREQLDGARGYTREQPQ